MARVLLIGATSAIAAELARLYAERGDSLFLVARNAERLNALARELGGAVCGTRSGDLDRTGENAAHVEAAIACLDEFARKFEPFFTEHDFRLIFSPEDLFGFSAEGITLQSQEKAPADIEDEVPF